MGWTNVDMNFKRSSRYYRERKGEEVVAEIASNIIFQIHKQKKSGKFYGVGGLLRLGYGPTSNFRPVDVSSFRLDIYNSVRARPPMMFHIGQIGDKTLGDFGLCRKKGKKKGGETLA